MAEDRQKVIQSAEKLAARGRIQAAIDEYRKVLDRHPNDTTTLNRVGDLYVRLNRLPKAIDLFQKTAESFGRQGFFVKAIAIYKKMIRLDPGQIRAYEALADLYNRQGLTGDSLAQYQVVADYYLKHHDADAALNVHYSMVEIEPENPTRRLQLAGVLQKEGKAAKAQEQYYEIASLMLTHSRGDDALKVLSGALDVDAGNLDFVRKAMHALQDAGFDRLAQQLLDEAIERNPQANALRLDTLEESAGEAPEQEVVQAPQPAVEEAEPVVEEEPAASTDAAEPEIDLSELEELPPADLDPVVEVDAGLDTGPKEAAETAAALVELEAPDSESAFELEDVDDAEMAREAPGIEPDAAEPEESVETTTPAESEEEFSFELDIDEVSALLADVDDEPAEVISQTPEAAPAPVEEQPVEAEAESVARSQGEWAKVLIEADVLGRYGMNEMAVGVLDRILQAEPEHAGALMAKVQLQLGANRADEALESANRLADLVAKGGAPERWTQLCEAMGEHGFEFEDGRFAGGVAVAPEEEEAAPASDEPDDTLALEKMVAETAALARAKTPALPDSAEGILAEVIEEIERADGSEGAAEDEAEVVEAVDEGEVVEAADEAEVVEAVDEAAVVEAADEAEVVEAVDEAEVVEAVDEAEVVEAVDEAEVVEAADEAEVVEAVDEAAVVEAADEAEVVEAVDQAEVVEAVDEAAVVEAVDEAAVVEAADVEWIRELERADEAASSTAPLEPGTGEFVDLATELEAELSDDGGFDDELLPTMGEQSLEDIVEGFRQGMAETLADEDYDTHYNLGIAYREMGLLDEAIGEFQLAAKDPRYLVESCSLLAACFVDKDFDDLAVQWYARGLESTVIDEGSKCGLLYELGSLLAATGEPEAARERFLELYGLNSTYRDVVAKLEELPS